MGWLGGFLLRLKNHDPALADFRARVSGSRPGPDGSAVVVSVINAFVVHAPNPLLDGTVNTYA